MIPLPLHRGVAAWLGRLASVTAIGIAPLVGCAYVSGEGTRAARESGSVQIGGSETMRPVVTACAEAFMSEHPDADIIVTGGGSGDGMAALLHGIVDIGMTSRELSSRERDYAASNGIELLVVPLALDGITIIVNQANDVTTLTLAQLRNIFAGRTRSWHEVRGADEKIRLLARTDGSGTASLFSERVLHDDPYGPSVQRVPTNEAIVAEVAARRGAIGYTGLGALRGAGDRIKAVALRSDETSEAILPTADTIRSSSYPLTRTLYLSAAAPPTSTVKAFVDFCAFGSGQAILQRAGYVGIGQATAGAHN